MDSSVDSRSAAAAVDLDDLMEKIRAEVAERKQLAGAPPQSESAQIAPIDFATHQWSARELLALPAPDFARAAHLAFFGREPSPEEFVRLRDRLLVEGAGRMRVLREFHRSPEARSRRLAVEGLKREFVRDRFYWSPPAKFGRFVGNGARNIWLLPRSVRKFVGRVETLERRTTELAATLRSLQSAQMTDRQNTNKNARQFQETIQTRISNVDGRLTESLGNLTQSFAQADMRLSKAETRLIDHWRGIAEHRRALEDLAAALAARPADSPDAGPRAGAMASPASHLLDPLYLSFEDRYRGTRDDIKQRQSVYLAKVEAAYGSADRAPVVDIGCGRGEWLELLSDGGIAARGYDLNRAAVQECTDRGLEVTLADGLEAIAGLASESCSAVTAFHIIEHLPFDALVKLLDAALRVLRPGGVLILETPNPANLLVAAERFYMDPTHRNPLPSELTAYLLQSRGFSDVEILPLHPVPAHVHEEYADPMLRLLQEKLYGPQDYGAIGRKTA